MSESNTTSDNSSTDDSFDLDYSSENDSSQLDCSSDDTSSHPGLPRHPISTAFQRKYLAMTKTHRRTVISQGRRRRAIRRISKHTVKMKHTGSILPTGPYRLDVERESLLGSSNVVNNHVKRKFNNK
jgi:hypothetical protein